MSNFILSYITFVFYLLCVGGFVAIVMKYVQAIEYIDRLKYMKRPNQLKRLRRKYNGKG